MLSKAKQLLIDIQAIRKAIKNEPGKRISKQALRTQAESLSQRWFSDFAHSLINEAQISKEIIEPYNANFDKLLKLSTPNNLKSSYLSVLDSITKSFRNDIVLCIQKQPTPTTPSLTLLNKLLIDISAPEENEYIKEAIGCAQKGFFRASIVLGWCAAIDRIDRIIEAIGFPTFNVTSAKMASDTKGRFKKFNQVQNLNTISELREVFDNIVLWIIEGMQLIDSNQHTRLKSCFDMRCQCAHPGEAPITDWNLLSFFSDLNEIIFKNTKFKINKNGSAG